MPRGEQLQTLMDLKSDRDILITSHFDSSGNPQVVNVGRHVRLVRVDPPAEPAEANPNFGITGG